MTHPFLRAEFLKAAEVSRTTCTEVQEPERGSLRTQLISKFADESRYPLHDHLRISVSVQSEGTWLLLGKLFPASERVLVFFEAEDDLSFFVVEPPNHLAALVGHTTGFTMYLANLGMSSLVALTSFDMLVAAGEAAARLVELDLPSFVR